jgi:hypothetical protein
MVSASAALNNDAVIRADIIAPLLDSLDDITTPPMQQQEGKIVELVVRCTKPIAMRLSGGLVVVTGS